MIELKVTAVAPGSGACKAGIRADDHVVSIDSHRLTSFTCDQVSAGKDAMDGAEVVFEGPRGFGLFKRTTHVTMATKPVLRMESPANGEPVAKTS